MSSTEKPTYDELSAAVLAMRDACREDGTQEDVDVAWALVHDLAERLRMIGADE